jgi:hypothetical protein
VDGAARVRGDVGLVRHEDDRVARLVQLLEEPLMISTPVFESRFPVGSSARRIDGMFTSARAIATRWRWPPGELVRPVVHAVAEFDFPTARSSARSCRSLRCTPA